MTTGLKALYNCAVLCFRRLQSVGFDKSLLCRSIQKTRVVAVGLVLALILIGSAGATKRSREEYRSVLLATSSETTEMQMPTMEIVVRLRSDVARAFQNKSAARNSAGAAEIESVLARYGAEMRPQHPGVSDPELGAYFTIHGISSTQADELMTALRHLEAVEAAYAKPPASPP
jgi:hypothetical protein